MSLNVVFSEEISTREIVDNVNDNVLLPILESPIVNIDEPIVVEFDNTNLLDYTFDADGVSVLATNEDLLIFEIRANSEFGSIDIYIDYSGEATQKCSIYTYSDGTSVYANKISKEFAWYDCMKQKYDEGSISKADWENAYSILFGSAMNCSIARGGTYDDSTTTIKGNVVWEVNNTTMVDTLPLRVAKVELIRDNIAYDLFGEPRYTDNNGNFIFSINNENWSSVDGNNKDIYIRVHLESKTLKVGCDWLISHYYYDSPIVYDATQGETIIINCRIPYDENLLSYKATCVHQGMVIAERFAEQMHFDKNNMLSVAYPGEFPETDLEESAFCAGIQNFASVAVIGKNSYNKWNTLVHEYSHYIQCSLGNFGEGLPEILYMSKHDATSDYYAQKGDKSFAMHLSYAEGWGYVFSAMAQRYYASEYMPLWGTNYDTDIFTIPSNSYWGEFQEKSVKAFLWSLIDIDRANCNIDTSNETLDYKLPWTPQEWWDMTTVSGTCRLPDFINLIENESYNWGVDIDYNQIKKYVAEKLTLFNIAPEVISVTQSSSNSPLEIKWEPNGSPSVVDGENYSNNKFVIKIWDENGNKIYENDTQVINVGRFDSQTHSIQYEIWSQLIAQKPCWTTFYVTVEGYRVDDTDDVYATSGPYCSAYFPFQLNFGHSVSCSNINSTTHKYTCNTCDIEVLLDHNIKTSLPGNYQHNTRCNDCGYNSNVDHNFVTLYKDNTSHIVKCYDCGRVNEDNHSYSQEIYSIGVNNHTYACVDCGYVKAEAHTNVCVKIDQNYHSAKCSICNYQTSSASHNWTYSSISNQHHERYCIDCGCDGGKSLHVLKDASSSRYVKCSVCGAWVDTNANNIFPTLPPNKKEDPSEETE